MAEQEAAMDLSPVRKRLVVPATPEVAFARFTREVGRWWPLATHSVFGGGAAVSFGAAEGEPIVERSPGGEEATWGTITSWDPPRRVSFTWHPGRPPETAQRVEVTFTASDGGTEVTLVHGGWEVLGDGAEETRRSYDSGWELVLGVYRDSL